MSSQTANYQLSLREANDIFNPLSTNDNFTKIDELLFKQTMPLFTSVVSGNLLTLSGTPYKQDTVFKFIATGSANTWSFGGSIYNIITPDGNQFSTESGKMYVGYVDENNMLVLLAWPAAVNAQTFDNQPSSYYATDSELQAVNTTAANAVQSAQAAQTVANNALEVARSAGITVTLLRSGETFTTGSTKVLTIEDSWLSSYKALVFAQQSSVGAGNPIFVPTDALLNQSSRGNITGYFVSVDNAAKPNFSKALVSTIIISSANYTCYKYAVGNGTAMDYVEIPTPFVYGIS